MSVSVRIKKVDQKAVKRRFRGMRRRSRDFSSVFRWSMLELQRAHERNFATRGAASGNVWPPLDNEYAGWKLSEYGAKGILIQEGTLKDSLTRWNARGAIRDISAKQARFGTTIGYAQFHQTGTRDMPQRKVMYTPATFADGVAQASGKHVVYGGEGGELYSNLKVFR